VRKARAQARAFLPWGRLGRCADPHDGLDRLSPTPYFLFAFVLAAFRRVSSAGETTSPAEERTSSPRSVAEASEESLGLT